MKTIIKLLTTILFTLLIPYSAFGAATLPWSTTYDCAEWTRSDGAPNCDDFNSSQSDWTTSCGDEEQITSSANFPGGAGGRGQRHWIGDGTNNNSAGLKLDFNGQSEFWIRYYFRYEVGFNWSGLIYDKQVYMNAHGNPSRPIFVLYGSNEVGIDSQKSQPNYGTAYVASTTGVGWTDMMGGSTSDGSWHLYEGRLKMDTNGSNGEVTIWIDNVQVLDANDANWGTGTTWNLALFGSNQKVVDNNGTCMYMDYDDVALSATGRIGPISVVDTVAPVVSGFSPAQDATGVTLGADVSCTVADVGDGVDISTIELTCKGAKHCCTGESCAGGTADLTCSGTSAQYYVTLDNADCSGPFSNEQEVNITIDADDLAASPNSMSQEVYSFTTVAASAPTVITLTSPSANVSCPSDPVSETLTANTDKVADLKWNPTDVAYGSMANTFSSTGGTSHSTSIGTQACDANYSLYVRAADSTSSTRLDYTIVAETVNDGDEVILFEEGWEDENYANRGWYDNDPCVQSDEVSPPSGGGTYVAKCEFLLGATTPTSGGGARVGFDATGNLYMAYWVKYSANWEGSNKTYHPHEFYFMTTAQSAWAGLANTNGTAYVEQVEGYPRISFQDSLNIDLNEIGTDQRPGEPGATESRAVGGCNSGTPTNYSTSTDEEECYPKSGTYRNTKSWKSSTQYFVDDTGSQYYKGDWHYVEAWLQMNTVVGNVGQADGIIRYQYDGVSIPDINRTDVIFRTDDNATIEWNQMILAPYLGDGSPIHQIIYYDLLKVSTNVDVTPPPESELRDITIGDGPNDISDGGSLTITIGQ